MRFSSLTRAALLFAAVPAFAQQTPTKSTATTPAAKKPIAAMAPAIPLTTRLPIDPKVRIGTLPNGIRYYIRQNLKPEKRAELRLVVNAGSVLEAPDQLALLAERYA